MPSESGGVTVSGIVQKRCGCGLQGLVMSMVVWDLPYNSVIPSVKECALVLVVSNRQ